MERRTEEEKVQVQMVLGPGFQRFQHRSFEEYVLILIVVFKACNAQWK